MSGIRSLRIPTTGRHARRSRSLIGLMTAIATLIAYVTVSIPVRPAQAADAETDALRTLVTGLENFVPGLAGVGAFGQPLKTLDVAPGSDAGIRLSDLLATARTGVLEPGYSGATNVDGLVGAINGKDGDISHNRHVSFTASKSSAGTVDSVTLGMHATRTVTAKLDIQDDSPQFSLTSEGGVDLTLTYDSTFVLNYDSSNGATWITRTGSTPSMTIGADAVLSSPLDVTAGLGILGIELADGSTLHLVASLASSWGDPNNDGRLAFEEPGGSAGDGELAAAGAGAGLVTTSMTSGTYDALLKIVGRPSPAISLSEAKVTVTVTAADLTTGNPQVTVTSGTLDDVKAFLTLSTRDLATGLAQAASTVMALQNSVGAGLPFMRGDFSNAVGAVEAITKYLAANVPEPTPASPKPGLPTFASLQDLLEDLEAIGGDTHVDVANAVYDAAKRKVSFSLNLTRAAGSPEDLNPVGTPLSGTATYTDTELKDSGKSFTQALVGRQVVAGTASGLVKTVSGDTLTLDPAPVTSAQNPNPTVYWNGGRPANGTTYSIAAADPKIGAVELGNALEQNANGAIKNANAKSAQAKVTPSFTLHLPIVLDLRDPDTSDCDPTSGTAACPYSYTANGITEVITSLPRTADRIMLHTSDADLLTADAPITTNVDVDATVGFLGVKVKGTLVECTNSPGLDGHCVGTRGTDDHLLSIALKPLAAADADGDIPFPTFVSKLTDALAGDPPTVSDLVGFEVKGHAYANLTVEVPGAPKFFGGTSPSAGVEITMPQISAPATFNVTPSASIGDLGTFNFDPDNPLALFGALLGDLQALQATMGSFPGSGALDTKIPLVGKSFNDVIGSGVSGGGAGVTFGAMPDGSTLTDTSRSFDASYVGRKVHVGSQESSIVAVPDGMPHVLLLKPALMPQPADGSAYTIDSELQGLINTLSDQSSNSLQAMLVTLSQRLGTGSNATFEVIDGSPDTLKLKLHWARQYASQTPMNLSFQLPSGTDRSLIGTSGQGLLDVSANGEINLSLLIPLDPSTFGNPAAALKIDPTESSVKAGVSVDGGDTIRMSANLGPFKVSLGDPDTNNPAGTQLKAGLGVDLTNTTDTDPESLSAFVAGLDVAVTGNGVACNGAPSGSDDLALCAVFPAFLNGAPINADPNLNKFIVRLPIVDSDLADTFNLGGPDLDGGNPRFVTPDGLGAALASAALNLFTFGDGLGDYLKFAENSLRTASFDGKLPLIGKDLQGGADFLGDVQTELEGVFSGPVPNDTDAAAIRTFVTTKVKPALPSVGDLFKLDVTCTTPLAAAAAPTATKNGTGSGTSYEYKIVSYTTVDGEKTNGPTSPASSPAIDHAALSAFNDTDNIGLTWAAVPRATGYRVLRSVDGGDWLELKDVGNVTTYTDKNQDTAPTTAFEDTPPVSSPCPDSTPADEVTGVSLELNIGQGKPTAKGCEDDPSLPGSQGDCIGADLPLDLGIPGLSIKATDATDPIHASIGWRLHVKVALDRVKGFYVDTQEGDDPEFRVGAELDVPDVQARIAFININETNNDTSTPEFLGTFSVDLHDSDGKLTVDDLISPDVVNHVTATLNADVDIDWHLAARPGDGSALPGISTDFLLTWGWTSDAPSDIGNLDIAFMHVKLDAGQFLGNAIKPIIQQVVDVFKPVQPVIDTLFEPIPVISDLSEAVGGDPVTIASLAQTFSTLAGGPDIQPFLDVLKNIRDLLKSLQGDCSPDPSPCINVGDFKLVTSKAVAQDANPATAKGLINDSDPSYNLHNNVKSQVNDHSTNGPIDANGADAEHPGFSFPFLDNPSSIFGVLVGQDVDLVKFDSGPLTLGFEFQQSFGPVYAPPPVNIVIGGGASVTLRIVAGFDTYGIRTAIEAGKADAKILDSLFFYTTDTATGKPLPVVQFEGHLQAGASVSLVVIEVGVVGGVKLTISFYWNDPNNDGKFRFGEFLATALTNPICLFNVGGELSVFIKVFITLGISPFSVSFDFTLVDVVILSFDLKPDCTPPPPKLGGTADHVLYLFAGKFAGKAQRAPGYGGAYPFDGKAPNPDADEVWVIRQVPAKPAVPDPDGTGPKVAQTAEKAKVTVTALGISEDFDDDGGAITTVVLDGEGYDGKLQVTFNGGDKNTPFSKKVVVRTGSGDDVIRTGVGRAIVDSGPGADQVTTLERTDLSLDPATAPTALVSGGLGKDVLTVGNGKDTVLGDKSLGFHAQGTFNVTPAEGGPISLPAPLDPNNVDVPGNPGDDAGGGDSDQIAAGLGGSTLYGNEGGDKIGTANDNPQADLAGIANPGFYRSGANRIIGGSGGDRIKSGSASDTIFTGAEDESAKNDVGPNNVGSGDLASDENSVDTGTGSDTVYGSNGLDFVTTHSAVSQTATAYGGGAADVLIGGLGPDKLYGGPDNDYLVAGPATVSSDTPVHDVLTDEGAGFARSVTLEPITPPVSQKTLVGGGGKDRIYGVDGPANIFGDHEIDGCVRQSDPVSKQPPEHPTTSGPVADQDSADLVLGGSGVDTVQAGGGDDHVFLFANADVACGNAGDDDVFGGNDDDLVYGGSDKDNLYGESGADELYGNTGQDSAYGGPQADRIQGNEGADFLTGGLGDDVIAGGTTKAAADDTGDRIYGDEGDDVLIGDNAKPDPIPTYPDDLSNTSGSPTSGGKDAIFGGDGTDKAYGGLDEDDVFGGNGPDYIEGNNASDHLYGEAQPDDIIGGSSETASAGVGRPDAADVISGGDDDDVIAGDNAQLAKVGAGIGSVLTRGRGLTSERSITLLDLGFGAATGNFGGDTITGDGSTDVVLGERGNDGIHGNGGDDYLEGGQDTDTIDGDAGQDDIVGGEFTPSSGAGATTVGQLDAGDIIRGGTEGDAVLGDNGALLRAQPGVTTSDLTKNRGITERAVQLYDLGDTPTAGTSGNDFAHGNEGTDVILGQSGTDRLLADDASDYAEGGPDADWVEGGDGSDDLVGGSSTIKSGAGASAQGQPDAADVVWGQGGDDVATGDNAVVTRVAPFNDLTFRLGVSGQIEERRAMRLLDLDNGGILNPPSSPPFRYGGDLLSGQAGVDVLLGQDGTDLISGGSADDYAEGQGAGDRIWGDLSLAGAGITLPVVAWPGPASAGFDADGLADGQDDLIGGKSQPGFRDGGDEIHGNGASDFVLGDNGTSVRDIQSGGVTIQPSDPVPPGPLTDRIYAVRYPASPPAGAAKVRHKDPAQSAPTPRFCTTAQATCEVALASGNDTLFGDDGDDFLYGQDGNDVIHGGNQDDDIFGELGNDTLVGEAGDDSILGDRGGVRDLYQTGSNHFFMSVTQVPKVEFDGFNSGDVIRVADLLHDVNGDVFVGSGTQPAMPHPGLTEGGDDRIRGGTGHDSIHAGFGDDLANGDSGGDWVFGDDGADVLWGGKGCDASVDTAVSAPYCYPGGIFDPAPHTAAGETRLVVTDYINGGKGGTSATSLAGSNGSDVIDWRPRGTYVPGTGCTTSAWPVDLNSGGKKGTTTTVDPCSWFEMTDINDADDANNQHHQGVDWQYGGWDRDILQGDQADNGPNEGDRLLDWNGAYNLYTHCNSAYGGFNDVRQHSPTWQDFLQRWVWAQGAGQNQSDATTAGTSAFVELALVYPGVDNAHGSGSAYPSTPGHFDDPNACAP
jgi:Ca2+-binding RTX toxin-like protein